MHGETAAAIPLRAATFADSGDLLAWRNDPVMRRAARQTAHVGSVQHRRWLADALSDPGRSLLVAELDGARVGQIRFDLIAERAYEVAITVAPGRRGGGVGRRLLRSGLSWLWSHREADRAEAFIRTWNEPSIAIFRGCGFRPAPCPEDGFVRLELKLDDEAVLLELAAGGLGPVLDRRLV